MPDAYVTLSKADRLEALRVAATASGRRVHLLEKDVWVVLTLDAIYSSPEGPNIVFKGGTSLSKAYGVIQRFSEDVDLTYDVRKLLPEFAKGDSPLPENNAQEKKWRGLIDERLPAWVKDRAKPILEAYFKKVGADAKVIAEGTTLTVNYDPLTDENGYNPPRVTLEFGARATGEPCEAKAIACDAAAHLPLSFPTATPRAMLPTRTFWEKATAVHVFCLGTPKGDRISRHWYDLVKLDDAGHAAAAFQDRKLAEDVAAHKGRFWRARDRNGNPIDYKAAVSGHLKLVPDETTRKALEADYNAMRDAGMLPEGAETFGEILKRCVDIQTRANLKG